MICLSEHPPHRTGLRIIRKRAALKQANARHLEREERRLCEQAALDILRDLQTRREVQQAARREVSQAFEMGMLEGMSEDSPRKPGFLARLFGR